MNRLIPTYPFPARKYTPVYLPTQPMEEEAQCRDNRHQEETDNLQHEDDSTKYHRDDKAVEEDECEHDEFCFRYIFSRKLATYGLDNAVYEKKSRSR